MPVYPDSKVILVKQHSNGHVSEVLQQPDGRYTAQERLPVGKWDPSASPSMSKRSTSRRRRPTVTHTQPVVIRSVASGSRCPSHVPARLS